MHLHRPARRRADHHRAGLLGLARGWFARRREDAKENVIPNIEQLSALIVDAGYKLHRDLGPGLLEAAYEQILVRKLESLGLYVDRQMPIEIKYDGLVIANAFKVDLLVERQVVVELKSVDRMHPVHAKQVITYLRLMNLPLGLLMNFGMPTFKEGVKRLVNHHTDFASSRLRANQNSSYAK